MGRDESGNHLGVERDMGDSVIREDTFNQAMKRVKDALDGLKDMVQATNERVAAIEAQNQISTVAKIAEAKEDGKNEQRLASIEKHLDRLTWGIAVLGMGFAGQLLWWIFLKATGGHS